MVLLASDLRYGFKSVIPRLGAVTTATALMLLLSCAHIRISLTNFEAPLTWGENLLCIWRAMLPYTPSPDKPFPFPMQWLVLLSLIAYVAVDYPTGNLRGFGASLIIAAKSRWSWWLAKSGWTVACALCCWFITLAVCALATLFTHGDWTLAVRPGIVAVLESGQNQQIAEAAELAVSTKGLSILKEDAIYCIVPQIINLSVALCALLLLQQTISIMSKPILGILSTESLLFLSAFFTNWWIPGNYLMLARSGNLFEGGTDANTGLALCLTLAVTSILIGGTLFCKKDIF